MKLVLIGSLLLATFSALAAPGQTYTAITEKAMQNLGWTWVNGSDLNDAINEARVKAREKCESAEKMSCHEIQANIVKVFTSEDQGYLTTKITAKAVFQATAQQEVKL